MYFFTFDLEGVRNADMGSEKPKRNGLLEGVLKTGLGLPKQSWLPFKFWVLQLINDFLLSVETQYCSVDFGL